jgi:hypothetical protein
MTRVDAVVLAIRRPRSIVGVFVVPARRRPSALGPSLEERFSRAVEIPLRFKASDNLSASAAG